MRLISIRNASKSLRAAGRIRRSSTACGPTNGAPRPVGDVLGLVPLDLLVHRRHHGGDIASEKRVVYASNMVYAVRHRPSPRTLTRPHSRCTTCMVENAPTASTPPVAHVEVAAAPAILRPSRLCSCKLRGRRRPARQPIPSRSCCRRTLPAGDSAVSLARDVALPWRVASVPDLRAALPRDDRRRAEGRPRSSAWCGCGRDSRRTTKDGRRSTASAAPA